MASALRLQIWLKANQLRHHCNKRHQQTRTKEVLCKMQKQYHVVGTSPHKCTGEHSNGQYSQSFTEWRLEHSGRDN